jgi:hypothetical protein
MCRFSITLPHDQENVTVKQICQNEDGGEKKEERKGAMITD